MEHVHGMSPLDATFLHVEDGINHMHIASCAVFEGPTPAYRDIVELFRGKLPLVPRYRQKVRFVPGALGRPVWVDDPHFRLEYHLRHTAIAPPGDDAALRTLMGRLMSQELDRHRPLWECWIVDGLAGGRWAIIGKAHHCMVDGIAGSDVLATFLDHQRQPDPPTPDAWAPAPEPSDADLVLHAARTLAREALTLPLGLARWAGAVVRQPDQLTRAKGSLSALAEGARALGENLRPNAPLSVEGTIGPHRRYTWTRTTLDDIKVIRTGLGGTVNDVVLTAISQGYGDLLRSRGEDVAGRVLHTLVPVSLRPAGEHTLNNQIAAIIAELPVDLDDPVTCLHAIQAQMEVLKASHQVEASTAMFELADKAPPMLYAAALRTLALVLRRLPQRSVNTVTTNVPGPRHPLYACGREMLEYLPYVPIAQGARTGIAVMSYDRAVTFGITADWDSVPDVEVLAAGIDRSLARLRTAAAPPPPRTRSGGTKRAHPRPDQRDHLVDRRVRGRVGTRAGR